MEQSLIPVRVELLPSGDRKSVCVLVQADEAIDMSFLLTSLQGWLNQTRDQFATLKLKRDLGLRG